MREVISSAARHPTAANLLMVAFILLGALYGPQLLRETFPRIEPREIEIRVAYRGATAETVERAICRRIEDALDAVEDLVELRCEARRGLAIAVAEMRQGESIARFQDDVTSAVDAIDDFPAETEDPIITQLGRTDFVATVAVTGVENPTELRHYAEEVRQRMLRAGVAPQVEVSGFSDRQIRIEASMASLRRLELSLADLAAAIDGQNIDRPAGEIEGRDGVTLLRFADQRSAVAAYENIIVVSSESGGQVRLGEIATVRETFEDEAQRAIVNGERAALLDITKTPREDALVVADAVRAFLEQERRRAPPGVTFTIINDGSGVLRDRLSMLIENGVAGLALVFVAMWAFFGRAKAFWIAAGLPVSFLGALAAMVLIDYSINMLTMVGLLIVIGILMDDAIVIAESVETERASGKPPLEAAIDGAAAVAAGVISSFLTTAAVFGSLIFLRGDIGEVIRVVPVVMLVVLAVSLVEAFLILPNHLAHVGPDRPNRIRDALGRWVDWMKAHVVGPFARTAVRWRYLSLGIAFALFFAAIAAVAGGLVKFQAFPELDGDTLSARIALVDGASFEQTEAVVAEALAALERVEARLGPQQPGGSLVQTVLVEHSVNQDAKTSGPHLATITVDVLAGEERSVTNAEILAAWRAETSEDIVVDRISFTEPGVGPAGLDLEIRLFGEDAAQLEAAAAELRAHLSTFAGVVNLNDDGGLGAPELRVRLGDGAGRLGIDAAMISDQLAAAFQGRVVDEIQIGAETYEIDVRLAQTDRDQPSDLGDFVIRAPSGALAPLSSVAVVEPTRGVARVNRIDGRRVITVEGEVDATIANASEIVRSLEANFLPGLRERFAGVEIGFGGSDAEASETLGSMARGLSIGLLIVFILLSLQFRSYAEPIVVMALIPFGFVGAVFGHWVMGVDLSMPSFLGAASLAGIIVNDTILLVNRIKSGHAPGETTVAEAAPAAAEARFRAIFLTSVTTIFGTAPLLFETSLQAQVLVPMIISIAFGLIAALLLILVVAPSFYAILDDWGLTSLAAERRAEERRMAEARRGAEAPDTAVDAAPPPGRAEA